ncbi:MAG: competence/damage-inducible protein A [Dialister invisus]|uniref:competence/damage-inducible protein A n=1 Tax=Dialister invisus TaxID=218538 RepID=UPI00399193D3
MVVEVITTGTELLLGEISNENSRWLAVFLNRHGFTVAYMTTVGDNAIRMRNAMEIALSRSDIVITSGGLGATQGDITKRIGAEALDIPYVYYEDQNSRLKDYYERRGRVYSELLERQAWFGKGSFIFENHVGSANGSVIVKNHKTLIHLPGPPFEMKIMAEREMMPWLESNFGRQGIIYSVIVAITGLTETEIESRIMDLIKEQKNPTFALLAKPGYIALRMTAHGNTAQNAHDLITPFLSIIKERLPVSEYHVESDVRNDLAELLAQYKMTMSAAESCTGGIVGKLMTDVPGSSAYFKGSAVTYWNESKEDVLGVSKNILKRDTAVSAGVAGEMAEGSRRLYNSDVSVSTTGYAGPGSGIRGENPGLVYIAVSGKYGTKVYEEHFMGNRESIRYGAADKALYYVLQYIKLNKGG